MLAPPSLPPAAAVSSAGVRPTAASDIALPRMLPLTPSVSIVPIAEPSAGREGNRMCPSSPVGDLQVVGGGAAGDAGASGAQQGSGQIILVPYYGPGTACPDGAHS